jgi:signal transduction histidine kinase
MGHQGRPTAARLPAVKSNSRLHGVGLRQRQILRGQGAHAAPPEARGTPPPGLKALRNWPVAYRLFAVIVVATVMGLIFGALQVSSAVSQADHYSAVAKLAVLGQKGVALATALEEERARTAEALAANDGVSQSLPEDLKAFYGPPEAGGTSDASLGSTGEAADAFNKAAAALNVSSYPVGVRAQLAAVQQDVISFLPNLRSEAWSAATPAPAGGELGATVFYSLAVASIFQFDDTIALSSGDPTLLQDVQQLGSLSRATDQVSQQQAIVWADLTSYADDTSQYDPTSDSGYANSGTGEAQQQIAQTLFTSQAQETGDLNTFEAAATPAQDAALQSASSAEGSPTATMEDVEGFIIQSQTADVAPLNLNSNGLSALAPPAAAAYWERKSNAVVAADDRLESQVAQSIVDRSELLQRDATRTAWETSILTGGFFLLVLLAALLVARSVVLPLRRLRAGALEVASVRLPERVRELAEATEPVTSMAVEPISVLSADEIGQVARAFDLVHQEAVRLAGNEALLRSNLNAMFVSLSRRSQSLVERLSRMIDSLELNEDDPERLSNLFSMDHLITRMRRNSENLLVLAGYEGVRKRMDPVPLADVGRAATSEIEQYERVVLNVQPAIEISGQASTDVIHLLAEIVENATLYSPRNTEVYVTAQELSTGGVLIEVTDGGVGISESRLEELNWRLENPPVVDVTVSRHMGLFAVAHLAARHGIRVRLRPSSPRGLAAMIWLPASVATSAVPRYGERLRRLGGQQHDGNGRGSLPGGPARISEGISGNSYASSASGASGQMSSSQAQPSDGWAPGQRPLPTRAAAARAAAPQAPAKGQETGQPHMARSTSNWFRSRLAAQGAAQSQAAPRANWRDQQGLVPPSWAAPRPTSGGVTNAGLPTRVPQASRGSSDRQQDSWDMAASQQVAAPLSSPYETASSATVPSATAPRASQLPQRSPEAARSRLAGFQRGSRRAEGQVPRAGEGTES